MFFSLNWIEYNTHTLLRHQETARVNLPHVKDLHVGNQYYKALLKENRSMMLQFLLWKGKTRQVTESLGPAAVSSNVRAALKDQTHRDPIAIEFQRSSVTLIGFAPTAHHANVKKFNQIEPKTGRCVAAESPDTTNRAAFV